MRSSRRGSSSGAAPTFLTVEPPATAAVVFFHEAMRKPSLFVGRAPPRPLVGCSPATCCERPLYFCRPTSGDVEATLEPLRFQRERPPNIGPWQPARPRPAPARNIQAMLRFIPPTSMSDDRRRSLSGQRRGPEAGRQSPRSLYCSSSPGCWRLKGKWGPEAGVGDRESSVGLLEVACLLHCHICACGRGARGSGTFSRLG